MLKIMNSVLKQLKKHILGNIYLMIVGNCYRRYMFTFKSMKELQLLLLFLFMHIICLRFQKLRVTVTTTRLYGA